MDVDYRFRTPSPIEVGGNLFECFRGTQDGFDVVAFQPFHKGNPIRSSSALPVRLANINMQTSNFVAGPLGALGGATLIFGSRHATVQTDVNGLTIFIV